MSAGRENCVGSAVIDRATGRKRLERMLLEVAWLPASGEFRAQGNCLPACGFSDKNCNAHEETAYSCLSGPRKRDGRDGAIALRKRG
jgi:hypothetical protein